MLNTILGIIGWVGVLLVLGAVGVRQFYPPLFDYARLAALTGLAFLVVYILSQWRDIFRSFSRRQARFSAMSVISIIAVLAILVGLNYLVIRRDKQWDLTASKAFTLSDETVKVLNSLKGPVKVYVFDQPNGYGRFRDALAPYELASKNVSVEYIDADRQPTLVKDKNVLNYGTLVFEYQGRSEHIMSDREQELTNGLVKVLTGRQIKAYFTEGHGEKVSTGVERTGLSSAVDVLKRDNYTIEKLVLAQTPEVPADASVVIVAGPTNDFLQPEIDALRKYLRKGGKALFMLDPQLGPSMHPLPALEAFLKEWGITMGHDVVLDVSGVGQLLGTDASVPVATTYPQHPITKDFTLLTAYPLAQSVSGNADNNPSMSMQNLINTGEKSWSESDVKSMMSGGNVSMDESKGDHKGPITVGMSFNEDAPDAAPASAAAPGATAPPKPQTRVVVLGDSDFASNAAVGIMGNSDLFVNINNWLTQQEDLISIHARAPDDRRITLTADQQRRIAWLSLLILPGLILGSGVFTWFQRR